MKIVFMGTPALSVPPLVRLIESRHEVLAVVTQPDRASGRGRTVSFSPVKQCAMEHGIPVLQPEEIGTEEFMDQLEQLQADLFAVVAYAQKIPQRLLEMPRFGCINMHPSLLPKYRGSAPFRGPILFGDPVSGVTIMKLVEKWDAGDILLQETFPVDPKDTAVTLEEKAVPLGAELMLAAVDGLEAGTITPVPQKEEDATYLKQIKKEEGRIDFSQPAVQIERQVRACVPWPSAYTMLEGKIFKIWDADVLTKEQLSGIKDIDASAFSRAAVPGEVLLAQKNRLLLCCGQDYLQLNEVQLEGKKQMRTEEFLRGKKLDAGIVFGA